MICVCVAEVRRRKVRPTPKNEIRENVQRARFKDNQYLFEDNASRDEMNARTAFCHELRIREISRHKAITQMCGKQNTCIYLNENTVYTK